MPELPEVQTVAEELNRKLKNRKIKSVVVAAPKLIGFGPLALPPKRKTSLKTLFRFKKTLIGRKFLSVKRRAKLLIFDLSGLWSILAHLKMTGQFIFEDKKLLAKTHGRYRLANRPNAPLVGLPSSHTRAIFSFRDGSRLYFNDLRKFGYLKLVHDREIGQVRELNEFGPEPLGKAFTFSAFSAAVKKTQNRKIKEILVDQKVVAGVGNIYSDEILFHSGVRPQRKASSLKRRELKNLHKHIRRVLLKGIKAKGSSVGEFVRTDGSWGEMGKYHFAYGRAGQKCKKCGTIIKAIKIGGRTASFCPWCQK